MSRPDTLAPTSSRASPPPSPLPEPPEYTPHRRRTDAGWRPADDDVSLAAIDYRARRGERIAVDTRSTVERLADSMTKLGGIIETQAAQAAARWSTASRLAWGVGIPVLVAGTIGLLALAGRFLSTLHH